MSGSSGSTAQTGAVGLRLELFVVDVERSLRWYVDGLGFHVDPLSSGTYRPVSWGAVRLALQDIATLDPAHPLLRGGRTAERGLGVEIVVELATIDAVRASRARAEAAGLSPSPLERQPWGLSDFRVVDPDGYYLRVTHVEDQAPIA